MSKINVPEKYKALYTTKKPVILVTGGRGSAKSFNVALFLLRLSYSNNEKILFTRYTMASADKSVIPEFITKIDLEGLNDNFSITKEKIINLKTGSEIIFSGIKTSSGNQTAKLKSIEGLTCFVIDEAEEWRDEATFDDISLSLRQKNKHNRTILIMNPCDKKHFIYKRFIAPNYTTETVENTQIHLSNSDEVEHIHTYYFENKAFLSDDFLIKINDLKDKRFEFYQFKALGQWQSDANGLMYNLKAYSHAEVINGMPICAIDTADRGNDYLCAVFATVTESGVFIHDVVYTKQDSSITIPLLATKIKQYECVRAIIELNGGGGVFYSQLQSLVGVMVGINNTANKLVRITSVAHLINQKFMFSDSQAPEYRQYLNDMKEYPKDGKTANDDAPDCTTTLVQYLFTNFRHIFSHG